MLSSLWETMNEGVWVKYNVFNYIFDANGNATHGVFLVWQNGAWAASKGNIVMYYNNGNEYMSFQDVSVVNIEYHSQVAGLMAEKMAVGSFSLGQNYPNPFNPVTTISYSVPKDGNVKLVIYDLLGSEVMVLENANKTAGSYKVQFNAGAIPSGIYFYRLEAGGFTAVKKLILLK
jgi:hypothetical protein